MNRRWQRILFATLLVASVALSSLAYARPYFGWDPTVAGWVTGLDIPGFAPFMELVSLPGTTVGVLLSVVIGATLVWLWQGRRLAVVVLLVVVLNAANEGLKALIGRPRPVGMEMDSFPSGHVFHTVVFLGVLWAIMAPRVPSGAPRVVLGTAIGAWLLLVGVSRVYLERHWPSDVIGGYLVGGVALWGLLWLGGRIVGRELSLRAEPRTPAQDPAPEEDR